MSKPESEASRPPAGHRPIFQSSNPTHYYRQVHAAAGSNICVLGPSSADGRRAALTGLTSRECTRQKRNGVLMMQRLMRDHYGITSEAWIAS